jgi:glycosyltransferase involved in cell wall biosynthesis
VPPRNPAAIAWAIEEIVGGHFAYDAGEAALFAQRFSPQRIADEVVDYYEEVLART